MARPALNEQRFLILTALAAGPLHGYGLVAEISAITNGETRPRPGSLYHGLDKMLDAGLVRVDGEETVDGRLRRTYAITDAGADLLSAEAVRRRRDADAAHERLAGRSSERSAEGFAL